MFSLLYACNLSDSSLVCQHSSGVIRVKSEKKHSGQEKDMKLTPSGGTDITISVHAWSH